MAPKTKQATRRAAAKAKANAGDSRVSAARIVDNLPPHVHEHFQQLVEDGNGLEFPAKCARAFGRLTDSDTWHVLAAKLDFQSPSADERIRLEAE